MFSILFDSFLDLIRTMIPTKKIIRPIVSVDIATDISAMLMALGGALVSSYRGLNSMIIIGIVKMLIAATANKI